MTDEHGRDEHDRDEHDCTNRRRRVRPWSAAIVAGALLCASCGSAVVVQPESTPSTTTPGTATTTTLTPSLPTAASVVDGRFVTPVQLDDGTLTVEPPGRRDHPTVPEAKAATEIWASMNLLGYHAGPLGFGIVTIAEHRAGVAPVTSLPAWVGFAVDSLASCPAEIAPSVPTTTPAPLPSSGYAAVVLGAATGLPVVAYTSRTSMCGFPPTGPSVGPVSEVVSIPWVALGAVVAGRLAVRAVVPPCGTYRGASVSGTAASMTITLGASVPDGAHGCSGAQQLEETVQVGPPRTPGAPPSLVSPTTLIEHGPLGAVRSVS